MERGRYREYVERFGSHLQSGGKSESTVACYTRDVGEFLGWLDANEAEQVDAVTEDQVAGFVGSLARRDLGERSKAKKLTSIRSYLVWARQDGLVTSVPRKLTWSRIRTILRSRAASPVAAVTAVPVPPPSVLVQPPLPAAAPLKIAAGA